MELGQTSTDSSVLRARWAGDRCSRFLALGLGRPLSSARVRFLWAIEFTLDPCVATRSFVEKESGGHLVLSPWPLCGPPTHRVLAEGVVVLEHLLHSTKVHNFSCFEFIPLLLQCRSGLPMQDRHTE